MFNTVFIGGGLCVFFVLFGVLYAADRRGTFECVGEIYMLRKKLKKINPDAEGIENLTEVWMVDVKTPYGICSTDNYFLYNRCRRKVGTQVRCRLKPITHPDGETEYELHKVFV